MFYGINHYKTHPDLVMRGRNNDEEFSSTHAEMDALLRAKRALGIAFNKHVKKMKIYVIRVNKKGELSNAKPCCFCESTLLAHGLKPKNIFYSNENGDIVSLEG